MSDISINLKVLDSTTVKIHELNGHMDENLPRMDGLTITTQYNNYTSSPITISFRDGTVAILMPKVCKQPNYRNKLVAITRHTYLAETCQLAYPTDSRLPEYAPETEWGQVMKHSFNNEPNGLVGFLPWQEGGYALTFDSADLISDYGLYVSELNAVIRIIQSDEDTNVTRAPHHPLSLKSNVENIFQSIYEDAFKDNYNLKMMVVDSGHMYDRLFINVLGEVKEIKVKRNTSHLESWYEDGLWLYSGDLSEGYGPKDRSQLKHFPLEGLCDVLPIFKTRDMALCAGDVKAQVALEMKERETQLKEREAYLKDKEARNARELAELKHVHETMKLESQQKIAMLNEEMVKSKTIHEQQSMQAKQSFEQKSYARKDSSETLKFAVSAIPVVVGLCCWAFSLLR